MNKKIVSYSLDESLIEQLEQFKHEAKIKNASEAIRQCLVYTMENYYADGQDKFIKQQIRIQEKRSENVALMAHIEKENETLEKTRATVFRELLEQELSKNPLKQKVLKLPVKKASKQPKILACGDLHYDGSNENDLINLYNNIVDTKPDIIIFGGDNIHGELRINDKLTQFRDAMEQINDFATYVNQAIIKLKYKPQIYFIAGNHEQKRIDNTRGKLATNFAKGIANQLNFKEKQKFAHFGYEFKIGDDYFIHGDLHAGKMTDIFLDTDGNLIDFKRLFRFHYHEAHATKKYGRQYWTLPTASTRNGEYEVKKGYQSFGINTLIQGDNITYLERKE